MLFRYVDDNLSDALLENTIPLGSTLAMDFLPGTEAITVTHWMETVPVAGHASGLNSEIVVV